MTETSLVLHDGGSHAVTTAADPVAFLRAAAEQGIAAYQFTQIKIPAGGGTTWEYEGPDGDESGKELDVIVAFVRNGQRKYYLHGLDDGEASAPDCRSEDGVHGLGFFSDHGDDDVPTKTKCGDCPMNKFGSSGKGKACSESAQLFAFLPGDFLPIVIHVPPTSLRPLRDFRLKQMQRGRDIMSVVTRITLEKVKASPDYSRISYKVVRPLSEEENAKISAVTSELGASYPPINLWNSEQRESIADVEVEAVESDWTEE